METFSSNALYNLQRAGWLEATVAPPMSDAQQSALGAVRAAPGRSLADLARELNKPRTTLHNTLMRLAEKNLIARAGLPVCWYPVVSIEVGGGDVETGSQ